MTTSTKAVMRQNAPTVAVAALVQVVLTLFSVGVALLLNYLIDTVSSSIATKTTDGLYVCAAVCAAYALTLGLLTFLNGRTKATCTRRIMTDLRSEVGRGILVANRCGASEKNSGDYLTLLNQNISSFEEGYLKNWFEVISSFTSIIIGAVLLVLINPLVALISIVAMSIPSLIPMLFSKRLGVRQEKIIERTNSYNSMVHDMLNGAEVIRTFCMEGLMGARHARQAGTLEEGKADLANAMSLLMAVTGFASVAVQFLIMTLSGVFAVKGIITIGSIVAVTQLSGQVIAPAFGLSEQFAQIKGAKPVIEALDRVLVARMGEANVIERAPISKAMEVAGLTYAYDGNPVLSGVCARFEAGRKYLITGKSGSGKSTLLKLLSGQLSQSEGSISVDGRPVLCDASIVSQDVFLFDDSLRNNIALYNDYGDEEICVAVRMSGLDSVVNALGDGLDTQVMENGARFSGGERQRIAIARALLHGKSTLLLDEATSALDEQTAKAIEREILGLGGVTCIAISHKLYPEIVALYDDVYELEHGQLVSAKRA